MTLNILADLEQGSDEWLEQRRGMVTASVVGQLVTVGSPDALTIDCPDCRAKGGDPCISAARKVPTPIKTLHSARTSKASNLPPTYQVANNDTSRGLTATLVAERITGYTEPSFMNDDMARGVMHEPIARDRYAEHNKVAVEEVGFMVREEKGWTLGYSPDGLVGDDGLLEIKCPRAKTHLRTVVAGTVPGHYMAQLQAGLLVSGREWIDFVSFCAGMPLWTKRVTADEKWQAAIVEAVTAFETAAAQMTSDYLGAVAGLPTTERIPDIYEAELKL